MSEKAYIDPKYIVHCSCGTTFVNYYTRGVQRKKCDACIEKRKKEWHAKNREHRRTKRVVIACSNCGKEREVSQQYAKALNSRGSGLCKSCCGKRHVESPDYLNKHEIICTQCNKPRIVSFSTYKRSLKSPNICSSCSSKNRRKPDSEKAPRKRYPSKSKKKAKRDIDKLAKMIKKKESNLKKVTADDIIKKEEISQPMTDEMIRMQKEWLAKNKIKKIKPTTPSDKHTSGQQMSL
jgi:hypothetical protein